ncbi:hypothetical protein [Neorhizobium lilium]|uniref:hypothetical protein n=1 Tax=Neorhizobium lilium TaxID=2503024 RepID=UPI001981AC11|nr:hypothetical protein [Neorhizobium lilium]
MHIAIIEKEGNDKVMAKTMVEQPERFWELRGKFGLFGDNKEWKAALPAEAIGAALQFAGVCSAIVVFSKPRKPPNLSQNSGRPSKNYHDLAGYLSVVHGFLSFYSFVRVYWFRTRFALDARFAENLNVMASNVDIQTALAKAQWANAMRLAFGGICGGGPPWVQRF